MMATTQKKLKINLEDIEFTQAEFEQRVELARRLLTSYELDALLVSSEANVEYFTGFISETWITPTRPFYFYLPREGEPTAIIPAGGEYTWGLSSWVSRVLTWPAPRPENEGVNEIVAEHLTTNQKYGRLGIEIGPESRIGMPLGDVFRLIDQLKPVEVADCSNLCRDLRMIKSDAEVARISVCCEIASDAFDILPSLVRPGCTEKDVVGAFQAGMMLAGADKTPFIGFAAGQGGYQTIITCPSFREIEEGDVLVIDTGVRFGGYFCDFDRNVSVGEPSDEAKQMHRLLHRATEAGIGAAKPGNTAEDLFLAQAKVLEEEGGVKQNALGRCGHGLGKSLTEWPSNKMGDNTVLKPGMVMTIEPAAIYGEGMLMVHEENLAITEDGCRLLSRRASPDMAVANW